MPAKIYLIFSFLLQDTKGIHFIHSCPLESGDRFRPQPAGKSTRESMPYTGQHIYYEGSYFQLTLPTTYKSTWIVTIFFAASFFEIGGLDFCFIKTWAAFQGVLGEWPLRSWQYANIRHFCFEVIFHVIHCLLEHSKPFPAIAPALSLGVSGRAFPLFRISSSFTVFLLFQE